MAGPAAGESCFPCAVNEINEDVNTVSIYSFETNWYQSYRSVHNLDVFHFYQHFCFWALFAPDSHASSHRVASSNERARIWIDLLEGVKSRGIWCERPLHGSQSPHARTFLDEHIWLSSFTSCTVSLQATQKKYELCMEKTKGDKRWDQVALKTVSASIIYPLLLGRET